LRFRRIEALEILERFGFPLDRENSRDAQALLHLIRRKSLIVSPRFGYRQSLLRRFGFVVFASILQRIDDRVRCLAENLKNALGAKDLAVGEIVN